jgi:hypothetical protein
MQENQIDDAVRTGYVFLEEQTSNARRFGVIKRILDHTKGQLAKNETIEFSWQDIADLSDHENEGKTLKKLIADVITELDNQNSVLNKTALGNDYAFLPKLKQTEKGGGAGNPNKYKIVAHSVDLEPLDIEIPKGHVRYKLEKIASPNFLARWVNNYVAHGVKLKVLIGGLGAIILLGLLIFCFGVYSVTQATTLLGLVKMVIGYGSFLFSLYYFGSPIYLCVTKRIVSAPIIFTPANITTAQLEYVATDIKDDQERSIRQFRIVTYSASCTICDGKIELEEGVRSMHGRLVGCCTESPREHIYSFDHKTKSGKAIFDEYIHWPNDQ